MNLEKLEKLNELKEKGILTQEEFEAEKKKILHSDTSIADGKKNENNKVATMPQKKINWKNVAISFFISLIFSVITIFITFNLYNEIDGIALSRIILGPIAGIIMCILAFSTKSGKYKNCTHPIVVFIVVLLLGPLGIWLGLYEFLQIKQGYAILKDGNSSQEKGNIVKIVSLVILAIVVLIIIIFTAIVAINAYERHKANKIVDEVNHLISNIMVLGGGQRDYEFVNSKEILIKASVIPESLVSGDKFINRYGGEVSLSGRGKDFQVVFNNVPEAVCKIIRDENWNKNVMVSGCDDCKESKCSITWSTSKKPINNSSVSTGQNTPTSHSLYRPEWSNQEICLRNHGGMGCVADVEYCNIYVDMIKHGGCYVSVIDVGLVMQDWETCQKAEDEALVFKITPEGQIIIFDQEGKDLYFEKLGEVMSDEEYQAELKEIYENYPEYRNKLNASSQSVSDATPFQQDLENLKQTINNIKRAFPNGEYGTLHSTPNLASHKTHSGGGHISYSDLEMFGFEVKYEDVPYEMCVGMAQHDYRFLANYGGISMRIAGKNSDYSKDQFIEWENEALNINQAQKICKACNGKCDISWSFGAVENEGLAETGDPEEVVWNDGTPKNINQAYDNASYSDQVSFAATFAECIEEQKFNQAYADSLPLDMRLQMAFSGGSNTSRQCKCIFQAARKYLGDAEYKKAQQLRQQGRNGSADKILEQAIPAAFSECF